MPEAGESITSTAKGWTVRAMVRADAHGEHDGEQSSSASGYHVV